MARYFSWRDDDTNGGIFDRNNLKLYLAATINAEMLFLTLFCKNNFSNVFDRFLKMELKYLIRENMISNPSNCNCFADQILRKL